MCWIAAAVDLGEDGGERFEVSVDVTDDGEHAESPATVRNLGKRVKRSKVHRFIQGWRLHAHAPR